MKNSTTTVPSSKAAPEILIWRAMILIGRAIRTLFFTAAFTVAGLAAILWLILPKSRASVEHKNLCASFSPGMNQKQVQDALDRHGPPYMVEAGHGQITVRDDVVGCILVNDGNGIVVSVATEGRSRWLER